MSPRISGKEIDNPGISDPSSEFLGPSADFLSTSTKLKNSSILGPSSSVKVPTTPSRNNLFCLTKEDTG